jgi:2-polyprenyl-3-methyl-5-hydroxy-6-metoxy-1,4-benzoquinol methylase
MLKSKIKSFLVNLNYYFFNNSNIEDIFSKIYKKKIWGGSNTSFYSGSGSHDKKLKGRYCKEIAIFCSSFKNKPDVLDLGCGDFSIGKSIRKNFKRYYAFDVVKNLIEYNKKKFKNLNVIFKKKDATHDNLPKTDIIIIREVFQHLSNENINKILKKVQNKCKYLIITEVVSAKKNYKANLDQKNGPIAKRAYNGSGVEISKPPFNFKFKKKIKQFELNRNKIQKMTTVIYQI